MVKLHTLANKKQFPGLICNTALQIYPRNELVPSETQRRTIYALSTPFGKAGVAVVRISGPDALNVKHAITRPSVKRFGDKETIPWMMERCQVVHPIHGNTLDDGLVVFFKGPRSFTTEDVLELHIHSGRAIIAAVLSALANLPSCRPAEAGEFTRRAFEGGRLDLTQVEGLKDLINAETEGQRQMALEAAGGAARAQFEQLRSIIIECLVYVEGFIDFGEDVDELGQERMYEEARDRAREISEIIEGHLNDNRRGEILRSGIRLAIFGPPNAGKSSLLNFLAQREAAIVTPIPGTTRDVLELTLDIGGLPVIVADTAGLRKSDDVVENIGVERAVNIVKGSNVSLCVLPLPDVLEHPSMDLRVEIPPSLQPLVSPKTLFLLNKGDLTKQSSDDRRRIIGNSGLNGRAWITSLHTSEGTVEFLEGFTKTLQKMYDIHGDDFSSRSPLITHARHRDHLNSALQHLRYFLTIRESLDFAAEELRYAAKAIGKVSGLIDNEDVLDVLFRDFCIGK
ncbi:tRNA modification GTPase TrmE [Leucogyrophana mollusca]|uniref:tRNA modification GTPase TrmE n=1 Tax=Leucogyrophana mollusca TaxID=85980 RepID=A0ACB8C1T2_9AGAM|nr:tRNA modification GTPase TrmE [Leucogyrophana mollusca]